MDGSRFDNLAKTLATSASRRGLLNGIVRGVAGVALGFGGLNRAEAALASSCRDTGRTCREDANCCSGHCASKGRTNRRSCVCAADADCPAPSTPCRRAVCAAGACTVAHNDGLACDNGNACTQSDTCQKGKCVNGDPVVCTALDECYLAGTCDRRTGQCSNPAKPVGSECGSGPLCCGGACKREAGSGCAENADCCSGICVGGSCRAACSGDGETCDEDADCCDGTCATATGGGICCPAGRQACVTLAGDAVCCGAGEACCGGRCQPAEGAACDRNDDCCSGICVAHTCRAACSAAGDPCDWPVYPLYGGGGGDGEVASDCCGELVCGTESPDFSPTCRANRPPVAVDVDVKHPWKFDCIPLTLFGYDPDFHVVGFRIKDLPQNGFFSYFVSGPGWSEFGAEPAGGAAERALFQADAPCDYPNQRPSACDDICVPNRTVDECRSDCYLDVPIERQSLVPLYYDDEAFNSVAPWFACTEGWYWLRTWCYVTFSTTFTGTDSFTYVAVDEFGLESEPALGTITIFEV